MASYTQEGRRLAIATPLGKDVLLLVRLSGHEEMSRLFSFELELLSERDDIAAKDIVGKNVSFSIRLLDDSLRYFNGFVKRFAYGGSDDRLSRYTAEVVPWLWFLTQTADCRIFQNQSVPKIIEQVFTDLGFSDFDTSNIQGTHAAWDFCVQYRETDFAFVCRLMEQEGIFFFFRHENGKHTLVLADGNSAYADCLEKEVEFAATPGASQAREMISSWEHKYEYRPGKWAQTDFNFETPTANLMARTSSLVKLDNSTNFEVYDFPGEYENKAQGDAEVKIRMEEEEVSYDVVTGYGRCRSFTPGGKFQVKKHRCRGEEGKTYVLVSLAHEASLAGGYTTGGTGQEMDYTNHFTCIPEAVPFRPARITPKPIIQGAQTAIVTGPAGEEIYTDRFGRVKVQFHWDREGKKDDKSSCWIRVAQPWAGQGWGTIAIPRIGQEVIVSFLEGDPDRPIITGRVYNADQMPPYALPANATVSGVKSNSSKGGGGFNEIRLEDKKGEEQVFIHAEKNLDIRVQNDRFETVKSNRHLHVEKDKFEHIDHNRNETVDADHKEKIKKDRHLDIEGKEAKRIGSSLSLTVKGDVIEVFKANHSEQTTKDCYIKASNVVIEGMQNITLAVGGSHIAIEPAGIEIQSSGQITLTGIKVGVNGNVAAEIKGGAMTQIQGAIVKIN
ncbi:MAG: type VI secretion system tip protein VgrG [Planctomycetes bacterium]|nr:type VI secretion system tip protein VgrG [Planctomycetota bacterium]